MAKSDLRIEKRRLRSSYITSTISITLLLLLLGIAGLLLLNTKQLSEYVKENILFKVVIHESTPEVEIFRIQKALDAKNYVKSTEYITKEAAAYQLKEVLGEDFIATLGTNPLKPVIEVRFLASYANNDSIAIIENDLKDFENIKEVYYQKNLIHAVNENVKKIVLSILSVCGLLFLIALALINHTIRLMIYSKRFIIRTMQLVGATSTYIRKPFVLKGLLQGIIGAVITCVIVTVIIYLVQNEVDGIVRLNDLNNIIILYSGLLLCGMLMNSFSTYFAVSKYLRLKTDKLYT